MTQRMPADAKSNTAPHWARDRPLQSLAGIDACLLSQGWYDAETIPVKPIQHYCGVYSTRYKLTDDDRRDIQQDLYLLVLIQTSNSTTAKTQLPGAAQESPSLQDAEIEAMVRRVIRNYALRRRRENSRMAAPLHNEANLEDDSRQLPDLDPSPLEIVIQREERQALHAAIACLSASDRRLIIGHHLEYQSINQLAIRYSLTNNAVKLRFQRARQKLRKTLQAWHEDRPSS
jgi:RNA polymerase sigma factor (sigma-70 family)